MHGPGYMVQDAWFRMHGSGYMVQDTWFRMHGSGCMILGVGAVEAAAARSCSTMALVLVGLGLRVETAMSPGRVIGRMTGVDSIRDRAC